MTSSSRSVSARLARSRSVASPTGGPIVRDTAGRSPSPAGRAPGGEGGPGPGPRPSDSSSSRISPKSQIDMSVSFPPNASRRDVGSKAICSIHRVEVGITKSGARIVSRGSRSLPDRRPSRAASRRGWPPWNGPAGRHGPTGPRRPPPARGAGRIVTCGRRCKRPRDWRRG